PLHRRPAELSSDSNSEGPMSGSHGPRRTKGGTAREVSPQQVCLARELAKSPVVVPIPGSSRSATIRDSAAAADLTLTDAEFAELDAA
ncbi:aldo/keto reductase, partial [Streptomyces sp. NPDC058092]|uniref:aldo/keto reductase n=1 Tax=Streptomyces sp. NPDC058092 TaxID=3346336 RepID=UPI0036E4D547